jgi:ABC-type nitrate/sulfonate/bicarbonate transport system substrate-binding protein
MVSVTNAIITICTSLVLCSAVQAQDRIRIGNPLDAGLVTFPLAQKRGFLKQYDVESEIIRMAGPVATVALANGEIDYFTGFTASVRAAIRGLPIKVVACYLPASPFVLIARPNFKSVRDLRGQTIGFTGEQRGPDIAVRKILEHFGLDPDKDVKFARAGTTEGRVAALRQGVIAATAVPVPWDFWAKKMNFSILARAYELFSYPEGGLVTTTRRIKEKRDEIKRVIKAGITANRYIHAEREGTIQFFAEWLKVDRDLATATYDPLAKIFTVDGSLPDPGFRAVIESAKAVTNVNREIAISEIADLSILAEAQAELVLRSK